jgi:hypothetical protein
LKKLHVVCEEPKARFTNLKQHQDGNFIRLIESLYWSSGHIRVRVIMHENLTQLLDPEQPHNLQQRTKMADRVNKNMNEEEKSCGGLSPSKQYAKHQDRLRREKKERMALRRHNNKQRAERALLLVRHGLQAMDKSKMSVKLAEKGLGSPELARIWLSRVAEGENYFRRAERHLATIVGPTDALDGETDSSESDNSSETDDASDAAAKAPRVDSASRKENVYKVDA